MPIPKGSSEKFKHVIIPSPPGVPDSFQTTRSKYTQKGRSGRSFKLVRDFEPICPESLDMYDCKLSGVGS